MNRSEWNELAVGDVVWVHGWRAMSERGVGLAAARQGVVEAVGRGSGTAHEVAVRIDGEVSWPSRFLVHADGAPGAGCWYCERSAAWAER